MKYLCLVLLLLSSTKIFSMCSTYKITDLITSDLQNAQNRKSFDEIIDDYEPCNLLLRDGFITFLTMCKKLIQDAETLNRAFNDSQTKEKQD